MGWEGYRLSQIPVVLYGFDNKPKFYDFIVLNAESKPVGTITAYARKAASTIIKEVSPNIKDYGLLLSKASLGGNKASLFVDWTGNSYVGLLGKSDETPTSVVNVETGNVAEEIKELEGAEIIQELQKDMLPALLPQDFSIYDNLTSEGNQELQEEIEASKTLTLNVLVDSMKTTCQQDVENTKAFWTELETEVPNITEMNDDEILDAIAAIVEEEGSTESLFKELEEDMVASGFFTEKISKYIANMEKTVTYLKAREDEDEAQIAVVEDMIGKMRDAIS
jgi:hypothetical protein